MFTHIIDSGMHCTVRFGSVGLVFLWLNNSGYEGVLRDGGCVALIFTEDNGKERLVLLIQGQGFIVILNKLR